ncbi:hypothetical protein [[Acholeplasma] multilocale]|uniref:hypothetical protein n=1 Tax=[Acholeplasma] multilocale TaxID=264638 RepID=UPI00047DC04D|nr:hypothetical protein [[Acholeplasma] multilocale]
MNDEKLTFVEKFKKFCRKLAFWKPQQNSLQTGYFDNILNTLFLTNRSEKKKVLDIIKNNQIESLLFYTDVRNVPSILNSGIQVLNDIKLLENEDYYVWSYLQHDESIDLEFDISSRGYFWKWASDINFKEDKFAVIGINPKVLSRLTEKDWIFDQSLNLVNITENIQPEAISWIMVRDQTSYKNIKNIIKLNNMETDLYLGESGFVKKELGE